MSRRAKWNFSMLLFHPGPREPVPMGPIFWPLEEAVCVLGLSSDCTDVTGPLFYKGSLQASPAQRDFSKSLPVHLLVPEWALRSQAHLLPRMGLDPALLLSSSQDLASDSTPSTLLLPNSSSSLPSCPAITWVEKGSLLLFWFSTTTNWGVVG